MKVLQINAVNKIASTGRNCFEIASYLQKQGKSCYTAYSEGSNTTFSCRISSSVECKFHAFFSRLTGLEGYYSPVSTAKLLHLIRKLNPDIVHLNNLHANYLNIIQLFRYLELHDIPTVVTLHDCWVYTGKCTHYTSISCNKWQSGCFDCPKLKEDIPSWFFDRTSKMWCDKKRGWLSIPRLAVIGVSDWITNEAKKSPMFANAKIIRRIYNWIDLSVFRPIDSEQAKEKLGLKGKKVILGVASEWSSKKGLDKYFHLARLLKDDECIILVGKLPNFSLPDNIISIHSTNNIDKLVNYYNAADVFLQLSQEETFGKVVAEALACGTPVITNTETANPELVDSSCGIVLPSDTSEDIINAARYIFRHEKKDYSAFCRARAQIMFDKENNISQYFSLYSELTGR